MKNLLITFFIFGLIYFVSFYKRPIEDFKFFDRTHTNYIKGFAIFLVILTHMAGKFGVRYLTPLGGTGVAMFLICSGYGLSESFNKKGLVDYWKNKIWNVWFPYFLLQSMTTILAVTFFSIDFSITEYLNDILLINYGHPFGWYLQILFFWYIIFYVIHKVSFLTSNSRLIVLTVISLSLIFVPNELWAEQALSFLTGFYLSYNKKIFAIKDKRLITIALLLIGVFFLAAKQINFIRNLPWILTTLNQLLIKLPLAIGIVLVVYQVQPVFKNFMFVYFSNFSFTLYLVHAYTIEILSTPTPTNILYFLVTTLLTSYAFSQILNSFYSIIDSKKKVPT